MNKPKTPNENDPSQGTTPNPGAHTQQKAKHTREPMGRRPEQFSEFLNDKNRTSDESDVPPLGDEPH